MRCLPHVFRSCRIWKLWVLKRDDPIFSRMRSTWFFVFLKGLGVEDCLHFATPVPLPLCMGKVTRREMLERAKAYYAWQSWDFVALKRKLLCTPHIASSHCLLGMSQTVIVWVVRKGISFGSRETLWDSGAWSKSCRVSSFSLFPL